MDAHIDISYSHAPARDRNPLHQFDLYAPLTVQGSHFLPPLICFIHGGAWRSEDKSDHRDLARKLATATKFPVAVPNYRLTPNNPTEVDNLRHPAHAEDIILFLTYLLSWNGPASVPLYDPSRIYLLGHSCGAHMLTSIFLDSSPITPSLTPSPALLSAVKGIVTSEGIYDLNLLLSSFPAYREWFIASVFGERDDYSAFTSTSLKLRAMTHMRWLVIHSKGDTLVDELQSRAIYQHLLSLYDEADVSADRYVAKNWEELDEEHNDVLRGDKYVQIVADFVLQDAP